MCLSATFSSGYGQRTANSKLLLWKIVRRQTFYCSYNIAAAYICRYLGGIMKCSVAEKHLRIYLYLCSQCEFAIIEKKKLLRNYCMHFKQIFKMFNVQLYSKVMWH